MTAITITPRANPLAVTVTTRKFEQAQILAKAALETVAIAGFFGDPGTGKTHALRYFCESIKVPSIYVTASASPQRKEIYEEILQATIGKIPQGAARDLRRLCQEVLSEKRRVLVIDECQNLRNLWHQQLRSMHDCGDADFALLLVGGTNAATTLKKDLQLWSRTGMRMTFEPLCGDELITALQALDPTLAATDEDLLLDIDERDCRGNLRNWTEFLKLARYFGPSDQQCLDAKLVRAVFAVRGVS